MTTGWAGYVPGSEPEQDGIRFLFMTCDCIDFSRGMTTGMDIVGFQRRSARLDTITVAEQDDVDAISWLWDYPRIMVGDTTMVDEKKLIFLLSEKAIHRKYLVTKTFKPYKRKEGGKTSYHLVVVTDDAIEPTDFVCKHCMMAAKFLTPGTKIAWLDGAEDVTAYVSNLVGLVPDSSSEA